MKILVLLSIFVQVLAEEVKLLGTVQNSMISNRLDEHSRLLSYHFCSLVDHLRLVTPPSRMLPADLLGSFWELLLKLQVSVPYGGSKPFYR